ncbi:hypothetical protein HNP99_003414 [Flavobacterium sp. 28A]|nr:hypothetical protein [Flavobacterium sp. 28A]
MILKKQNLKNNTYNMKKKSLLILIILFGCYYLYSFTSENIKYEILNEIIKDNELTLFKICSKSDKIEIFENILIVN